LINSGSKKEHEMRLLEYLKEKIKQPRVAAIVGVFLGLSLGLLIGWVAWPVSYTDAVPEILSQQYQEEYLRMAIDSYGVRQDVDLAEQRWKNIGENALPLFVAISQNPGNQDIGAILGFKAAVESRLGSITNPLDVTPTPTPTTTPGVFTQNKTLLIVLLVVVLLGVFGGAGYYYFLRPLLYGKIPSTGETSAARQAQDISRSVEKTDYAQKGLEKPITQTMTTYVLGDDLYDESFSIDSPSGEYLGQYGVGISDLVGVGDSQKVTAFEVWLFEKGEYEKSENKTCTKVLMSEHAFEDWRIKQRLESKGELVLLQPQAQILLETGKLQLLVTVVDLEYGQGNLPEKSYFERITLELAIWPKG
jgi:hypothetical protein